MKKTFRLLLLAALAVLFSEKTSAQNQPADSIYMMAQKMPEYPGGRAKVTEYLVANVKMPQKCRDANVGGMTIIEFVVEKDGKPSNFKVGVSATDRYKDDNQKFELAKLLDEEALRLARNMQNWSPAEQDGQAVRMRMRLPVKFTISF